MSIDYEDRERIDKMASLLRRCAIELEFVQCVENCGSGLCATGLGKQLIEESETLMGPMRDWPENS